MISSYTIDIKSNFTKHVGNAPFTYTEIITGAILGYLIFHDVPNIWLLAGLAVIIASGIAVAKSKKSIK